MVSVSFDIIFERKFRKIKGNLQKERIKKLIHKIIKNPEVGKPMMHERKGTRELYLKPFRLSYSYLKHEDKIILLDLYHKDVQ